MKLYSENKDYKLYQGTMLDMLEVIEPNTIDSIVCDPPYELNFMGKGWDNSGIAFQPDTWKKCYEVLKPGGYLLAFGGSRTFHRIACAIEDAGFEIRDTIMWLYGSGFPKSMDISKQLDKRNGKQNEDFTKFGNYVKQCREARGYSKNDIDKIMGTNTAYAWWEGRNYLGDFKVQLPDKENYYKLKKLLELDDRFDYLIEWQEAEREVVGKNKNLNKGNGGFQNEGGYVGGKVGKCNDDITIPTTDLAKQWNGWGTALKPSFEPIIVARKPFKGSLVDNIIEYGVGGINIDECRVETQDDLYRKPCENGSIYSQQEKKYTTGTMNDSYKLGRFPANTILTYDETDFDEVCGGFPNTKSGGGIKAPKTNININNATNFQHSKNYENVNYIGDSGSASRYFYCAKASKKDRDEGLDEFEEARTTDGCIRSNLESARKFGANSAMRKNTHPTVKPTDLMQYLVRLVSQNGATILDPFNGSGSTGKAVMYENKERNKNYKYIGIELTEEYLPIAKARIEYVCDLEIEKDNQMSIFDLGDNDEKENI